jgi:hypothetical protein
MTHEIHIKHVDEVIAPDRHGRLGAFYKEDSRNKDFEHPVRMAARGTGPLPIKSVRWPRHIPIMNQNKDVSVNGRVYHGLGSCCPNSGVGVVSTGPFKPPFAHPTEQRTIVPLYEMLTAELGAGMTFPPHDTGSNIADFMAYAKQMGWISEYNWVYTLKDFIQALMHGPVQIGINYLNSYDRDALSVRFKVDLSSGSEGWHALCADEVRVEDHEVWYTNSWGTIPSGANKWDGRNYQKYSDLDALFGSGNIQVAVPIPVSA